MPTYEYKCTSCDHRLETMQSMKDAPLTTCPSCGKETLTRLISAGGGMIFKGTGFYLTDYKNAGAGSAASAPSPTSPTPKPSTDSSTTKSST